MFESYFSRFYLVIHSNRFAGNLGDTSVLERLTTQQTVKVIQFILLQNTAWRLSENTFERHVSNSNESVT